MTKKEDEIQALDPGEEQIRRRVRHNSIHSGKPNFSHDPDGPAETDSEKLTETHGSHDNIEESSNSRCHTWLTDAKLRGDDMEKSRVMQSSHCTVFKVVESLLFCCGFRVERHVFWKRCATGFEKHFLLFGACVKNVIAWLTPDPSQL